MWYHATSPLTFLTYLYEITNTMTVGNQQGMIAAKEVMRAFFVGCSYNLSLSLHHRQARARKTSPSSYLFNIDKKLRESLVRAQLERNPALPTLLCELESVLCGRDCKEQSRTILHMIFLVTSSDIS